MKVNTVEEGNALIALAEGRIDSSNALDFDNALGEIIEKSHQALILDFEALSYISSAGLRVILLTAKSLQRLEREFVVCSLSDTIAELFKISGFDKLIQVQGTRAEALATVQDG